MKRRKNFLFSGSKRFEVRVYPYGMEGYVNQGEQNIKRKKFANMRDACRWFDANDEYPLVELVDLEKDHLVASGGTGKKFNPKKHPPHSMQGVLRSTNLAGISRKTKDGWSPTKIFLSYMDGSYVVHGRFQVYYRSRKVQPNTEKGRAALNRAIKKFEELEMTLANPKKRKRKRKAKTEVSRRDAYAEMAKARKTTRGHKRKDRKRSVARGSSRKPKHRVRLNPYDKPNKEKGVFDANVKKRHGKLFGLYRGFYNTLEEANVEDLPDMGDLREESMKAAIAIESTRFPELKGQSYETIPATQAAKEALSIDEDGIFAPYARKYAAFFKPSIKSLTAEIKKNQAEVKKARGKTSTTVSTAKEDAELRKLEAEMERRLRPQTYSSDSAVEAQRDQQASMRQREFASELLDDEEPLEGELPRITRKQSRARRVSRYEAHLADTRRSDVSPPLKVLADARQDVLLYALKDGTTQVWSKGSITETFLPSKKTSSVTIAHRYANWWRGLDERGKIREKAKKSRLRSRVLLAVEGRKGVKVIEPSIAQEIGRVQRDVIGTHALPSLDSYELKGPRANPSDIESLFGPSKANWPWAFFGTDGKVYDKPPDYDKTGVRFRAKRVRPAELKRLLRGIGLEDFAVHFRRNSKMVAVDFYIDHEYDSKRHKYVERLFAFRDGQPYRVALTRIKELYGEGPKGMDGTSTMMSESEWRYLRPVKAKVASGPSETGHIYNPRSRKNAGYVKRGSLVRPVKVGSEQWDSQVGVAGWSDRGPRHIYLYDLDAFDKKFYRDVPLKKGEKLFRFVSDSTNFVEPHARYLVKINVDRDLIYFMAENQPLDERMPRFKTRGLKARFLKFERNPRRKNPSVRYRVMYTSVDGAGYYKKEGEPRTWATKEAAIRFADSKQENSDKSGNPWGYYYSVHTDTYPSRVVYRTR